MKKIDKIPEMRQNPSDAWTQVQILRSKLNEVIGALNGEIVPTGKSKDERIKELKELIASEEVKDNLVLLKEAVDELALLSQED